MSPAVFQSPFVQTALPVIVSTIIVLGINVIAFDTMNRQFDNINRRLDDVVQRLDRIETKIDDYERRITRLEIENLPLAKTIGMLELNGVFAVADDGNTRVSVLSSGNSRGIALPSEASQLPSNGISDDLESGVTSHCSFRMPDLYIAPTT